MRELNPSLFENAPRPANWNEPAQNKAVVPVDQALMERQIAEMQKQIKVLEKIVVDQNAAMEEHNKVHQARWDRAVQHIKSLESVQTGSLKELHERLAAVMARMSERRSIDIKMEEMIDRHNELVQNFDLKLKALQKTLAEREVQILKVMAQLEDARAELFRLKRS